MSKQITAISPVSNGGSSVIDASRPYIATVMIQGSADILFHAWNCEAVEVKGNAPKGSKAKKTDDLESYVYRNDDGDMCLPGTYIIGTIVNAARFRQDPRSPRKSAMDLFKAGVTSLTPLASLGVKHWDYEHKCRAIVNRSAITRTRPALKSGWTAVFDLAVVLPEYISQSILLEVISSGGRLVGIADNRPTYGRFQVIKFEVNSE